MPTRWVKVLKDILTNKARTVLVILSIAVGVFAIGMTTNAGGLYPSPIIYTTLHMGRGGHPQRCSDILHRTRPLYFKSYHTANECR